MKKLLISLLLISSVSNAYFLADKEFTIDDNPEVIIPIIAGTTAASVGTLITVTLSMIPIAPEVFGITTTGLVAGTLIGAEVFAVTGAISVIVGLGIGAGEQINYAITK